MNRASHSREVIHSSLALLLVLALSLLFLAQTRVAFGATITVNTSVDESTTNGNCSLREDIQAANTDSAIDGCAAGSGADVINLPAGTYTLTTGAQLSITQSLTLTGAGRTRPSYRLTRHP